MRTARIEDAWRRVCNGLDRSYTPLSIDLAGVDGFSGGKVELQRRLTVFAGLNGAGKTRLLQAMNDQMRGTAKYVSLGDLCHWFRSAAMERNDLSEVMAEYPDGRPVPSGTLAALSEIVRRGYDSVEWFELDFVDSPFREIVDDDVVPFFKVSTGSLTYDSREMGMGELAVHTLVWLVERTASGDAPTLLLDEPDSLLPTASQESLLDYLVLQCDVGRRAVVLASHSTAVVLSASRRDGIVKVISRGDGHSEFISDPESVSEFLAGAFSHSASHPPILFVEDDCAEALLNAYLRLLGPGVAGFCTILRVGGEGDLIKLIDSIPRPTGRYRGPQFAAVLDGDSNASLGARRIDQWPILKLPGDASPDESFRGAFGKSPRGVASTFSISSAHLQGIADRLSGREHHNWTAELVALTGLTRQVVIGGLASMVVKQTPSAGRKRFLRSLAAAVE